MLRFRLPEELHATLVRLAQEERRSLNSEMILRLEESIRRGRKPRKRSTSTERHRRYRTPLKGQMPGLDGEAHAAAIAEQAKREAAPLKRES